MLINEHALHMHVSCRPQIATAHGVDWKMFDSDKEAAACVDELIAENRKTYGTRIDPELDWHSVTRPQLFSKFGYIHNSGTLGAGK